MRTLIIYDSAYGNTEKIARAIAGASTDPDGVQVLQAGEAVTLELAPVDLLIVGSPTQGGRPTPAIQKFLSKIPANGLENIGVAAFDTRFSAQDQGIGLRLLISLLGYAAGRIANSLKASGGRLAMPPEGFIVEGKEGPLKQGELERAAGWATEIYSTRAALQYAGK